MKPFGGTVGLTSTTPLQSTFLLFLFGPFSAWHNIVWSVTWFSLVLKYILSSVEWQGLGPKCSVITKTQRVCVLPMNNPPCSQSSGMSTNSYRNKIHQTLDCQSRAADTVRQAKKVAHCCSKPEILTGYAPSVTLTPVYTVQPRFLFFFSSYGFCKTPTLTFACVICNDIWPCTIVNLLQTCPSYHIHITCLLPDFPIGKIWWQCAGNTATFVCTTPLKL